MTCGGAGDGSGNCNFETVASANRISMRTRGQLQLFALALATVSKFRASKIEISIRLVPP